MPINKETKPNQTIYFQNLFFIWNIQNGLNIFVSIAISIHIRNWLGISDLTIGQIFEFTLKEKENFLKIE